MVYINTVVLAIIINQFVGIFVLCFTDKDEELLYKWYKSCPSWWVQLLVIQCWPLIVWYYKRGK